MPKLPTEEDFNRPTPSASRQIVTYKTGQEATAISEFGNRLADFGMMVDQEQKRLDDVRAEDALNKAKLRALELSNGDDGFTKVKGEGVVVKPVRDDYSKRFSQSMKEIEGSLSNPNQINVFRRRVQPLSLSYQSSLLNHVGNETSRYQDETDVATIDIETQEAAASWRNPQSVVDSAARIKYTVSSIADRKGLSGDAKKQLLNDSMTKMHKGVIVSMLESTPEQARFYYSKNKKAINGLDRPAIEKALQAGSVKAESQSMSDTIIGKDLSYADSLKEARKAKDPDVREATVSLVKQRFNEVDGAVKDAVYNAGLHIAENGTLEGLPQETIELIPADKRNTMEKVAREQRQGVEPIQDHKKWADFNQTVGQAYSGNKNAINKLKNMDVYGELRLSLDDSHYDQALVAQRAFVTNDAKEKAKSGSLAGQVLTNKAAADVFINRLLGAKKNSDRSGDGVTFADKFYLLAQSQIDQWGLDNPKKKIPPGERNKIYSDLAQTMMVEDGGFMYFDKEYDITDIPDDKLNEIANDLRQGGIPVTGRSLVSAYLAAKEKGLID